MSSAGRSTSPRGSLTQPRMAGCTSPPATETRSRGTPAIHGDVWRPSHSMASASWTSSTCAEPRRDSALRLDHLQWLEQERQLDGERRVADLARDFDLAAV